MPKPIIPPHDPTRLARMQDERLRMFGVDKAALDAHVQLKREAKSCERQAVRAAAQASIESEAKLLERAAAASQARRAQEQGVDAFRQQQQAERRQREVQQQQEDEEAAALEQAANLASPWLNEAPELGVSALAPHRVRPDHFKAFTPHQRADIHATQAEQVEAKRSAMQNAAAEQAAFQAATVAAATELERHAAAAIEARRREAAELAAQQQLQAAKARQRQAELAAVLDSQQPTPAYFAQFGTSHR